MREQRLYTKESWLRNQYWDKKLSTEKIGASVGVTGGTIRKLMSRRNIETRTLSEAKKLCMRLYWKPSWLRQKYCEEKLSADKIATLCGVKGNTIRKHMKRLGISARSYSEARLINYPVSPYRNKKWLEKAYWKEGNSLPDLSIICGRDRTTIRDWFRGFGIPVRSIAEAGRLMRKKHCRSKLSRFTTWLRKITKSLDDYKGIPGKQDN